MKTPDAVRSPVIRAGAGSSFEKLVKIQSEFAAIMQTPRVYVRLQGTEHFITGGPDDTLYHPSHSPQPGESRYQWTDRGDGVFLGNIKSDE